MSNSTLQIELTAMLTKELASLRALVAKQAEQIDELKSRMDIIDRSFTLLHSIFNEIVALFKMR